MSDAAAAARAELAARQRSWMQQRQAEQDRIQAETSIRRERIANPVPVAPQNNHDSSTGAAAVAGMDTEVLDAEMTEGQLPDRHARPAVRAGSQGGRRPL